MENEEAIKLKKEINKIEIRIIKYSSKYETQIQEKREQMEKVCTHSHIKEEYSYIPGSYYDRCVYINKIVCEICGKVLDEKRTIGGYG